MQRFHTSITYSTGFLRRAARQIPFLARAVTTHERAAKPKTTELRTRILSTCEHIPTMVSWTVDRKSVIANCAHIGSSVVHKDGSKGRVDDALPSQCKHIVDRIWTCVISDTMHERSDPFVSCGQRFRFKNKYLSLFSFHCTYVSAE